jgi:amino acid permease
MGISVTTSFLGLGISLYHFLRDSLQHRLNSKKLNKIVAGSAFCIVPILIVYLYPNIFVAALRYSGLMVTVVSLIFPAAIAVKIAYGKKQALNMKIVSLMLLLVIGLFIYGISVFSIA